MFRPTLALVTILFLLQSARVSVSGIALPLPSSCRDEDGPPSYLQPNGGGVVGRAMPNLVQKNESYVLNELWTRQLRWSKLSKQMKNQVYFGRLSALVILISGSVLQHTHKQLPLPFTKQCLKCLARH
jgi:hypothetical protein